MEKETSFLFLPEKREGDIICALATPPGESALALIRLSGKGSFDLGRRLCPFLPEKILSHYIYFGALLHPESRKILDEVLVFCFEEGRSFTGEESLEISCHGSRYLSSVIVEALVSAGARPAERGEFSYRAFMNGRMDLVQAESVLELIQSRSPKACEQALRGLRGKLSDHLKALEKKLLKLLSHLEASIDFSDQEIEPFSTKQQQYLLKEIKQDVIQGLKGFHQGRINREGFSIVLLGATNAGKSSLFNCLIQEDKAIVTEYPGTTRDILSARLLFNQREFCLKDTAGFREKPDPVEKKGIQKVSEEIQRSDLCLFLVESALPLKKERFFGLETQNRDKTIVVFSKADQLSSLERKVFLKELCSYEKKEIRSSKQALCLKKDTAKKRNKDYPYKKDRESPPTGGEKALRNFFSGTDKGAGREILWLSSRTGEGMEKLKQLFFKKSERESGEIFLSTSRQFSALKKIKYFLDQAEKLLNEEASPELSAYELQSALSVLYTLLGREYNEEVIKQVFKEFCLGK